MDSQSRTPERITHSPPPGQESAEPQSTHVPPPSSEEFLKQDPADVSSDAGHASGVSSIGPVALTGLGLIAGVVGAGDSRTVDVAPTQSHDPIEQAIERHQGTYERQSSLDGITLIATLPALTAALSFLRELLQLFRAWREKEDKEAKQPEVPARITMKIPGTWHDRDTEITIETAGDPEVAAANAEKALASLSSAELI